MANLNRFGTRLDHFSRRGFLGGTGALVIVGLPMLEVLSSRRANAQNAPMEPIRRLLCIASGNGLPMDEFTPDGTGTNYQFKMGAGSWGSSTILKSFAPLKSKVSIFTGLGIDEGKHSPGDHGAGMPVIFTCAKPAPQYADTNNQDYKGAGLPAELGVSIDQVYASKFGGLTPRNPTGLQIGLADGLPLGDGPFGPVYLKNLSWASPTKPMPPLLEPAALFDKLFGGQDQRLSAAENARRSARRTSILDYVAEERTSLLTAVNKDDRQRLDQFFTAARELETQLQAAQPGALACDPGMPPGMNMNYPTKFKAMSDLIALAFTCNVARTVMFQLSCYRNDAMYASFLKVKDNHHSLSHAGNVTAPDSDYRIVCRWIMDQVAQLLTKLDEFKEPNGLSILDNSLTVYNSDAGDGNSHDHKNLPVIVVGSAGGKFPAGRFFKFPSNTPANGLYVTMLQALGVDTIQIFGDKMTPALDLPTV